VSAHSQAKVIKSGIKGTSQKISISYASSDNHHCHLRSTSKYFEAMRSQRVAKMPVSGLLLGLSAAPDGAGAAAGSFCSSQLLRIFLIYPNMHSLSNLHTIVYQSFLVVRNGNMFNMDLVRFSFLRHLMDLDGSGLFRHARFVNACETSV